MKSEAPVDLLLECLRHVALRYDRKIDRESLLAALPVDQQKGVAPALFPRVAARAGFKAAFAKTGFEALSEHLCLLYTSPSPRDGLLSRMPSSA